MYGNMSVLSNQGPQQLSRQENDFSVNEELRLSFLSLVLFSMMPICKLNTANKINQRMRRTELYLSAVGQAVFQVWAQKTQNFRTLSES